MSRVLPSVTAAICWGAMFPIAASAVGRVDPFHLTFLRYLLAGAILLLVLAVVEGRSAIRFDGRFPEVLGLGVLGFAAFNMLAYAALTLTTPQHASLLVATMPLMTVLLAWQQGARPPRALLAAMGAALFGVALVITNGDPASVVAHGSVLGDLMVLAGAMCWVVYTTGSKRYGDWSPLRFTALTASASLIGMALIIGFADATGLLHAPSPGDVGAIAPQLGYVVVFGAVVAVLSWNVGVQRLGPSAASLFMNLVPVVTFAIEAARGQQPTRVEIVGATITVGALVAANRVMARQPVPARSSGQLLAAKPASVTADA